MLFYFESSCRRHYHIVFFVHMYLAVVVFKVNGAQLFRPISKRVGFYDDDDDDEL